MSPFYSPAEAEEKYGAENLKIYKAVFTPMYHSMTKRVSKCRMKLICLTTENEKVSSVERVGGGGRGEDGGGGGGMVCGVSSCCGYPCTMICLTFHVI